MKIIAPVIKVKSFATAQSIKLSEKTVAKTQLFGNFLTMLADAFIFIPRDRRIQQGNNNYTNLPGTRFY